MHDIGQGFRIGDRLFAWGITADEASDALGQPRDGDHGSRWRRIELGCRPTWGFDTIGVELTAHGGDRPVTGLKYELAAVAGDDTPNPARWVEPLSALLGPPGEANVHEVPADGDASGSVRFYASWPAGDQSVGLSLYGAPRHTVHGRAAGCVWLNWATGAAASPFVDEWRRRRDALAVEARDHSGIVSFALHERQFPVHSAIVDEDYTIADDDHYALHAPQLLTTPASIAREIGVKGVGFWRSGDQSRWFASTHWDSIAFALGETVEIDVYDIKPAKGGGFAEIAVDGWRVRDLHGSRGIAEAVEALRTIPGVSINIVDGYDC